MTWFLCIAAPTPTQAVTFIPAGQWGLVSASDPYHADTKYRAAVGYGPDVTVLVVALAQVLP